MTTSVTSKGQVTIPKRVRELLGIKPSLSHGPEGQSVILVDTNVILDLVANDPVWADWSLQQLESASLRDELCINAVIYAELSIAFATIEELEALLARAELVMQTNPARGALSGGKGIPAAPQARGTRHSVLPDFLIGAHAEVQGLNLLTRDTRRYATYFPAVKLIGPST